MRQHTEQIISKQKPQYKRECTVLQFQTTAKCKEYTTRIPLVHAEPIAKLEAAGYNPHISFHLP